jgi:hypothetical protein
MGKKFFSSNFNCLGLGGGNVNREIAMEFLQQCDALFRQAVSAHSVAHAFELRSFLI